ncbi:MAG: sensor histidine kinase [Pirellulales bacterium]
MSYRSIKLVLGETNLERKCRILYGSCLLLLITGSFWWYGQSTEQLVHDNNRSTGRHLVDAVLLKLHWKNDEPSEEFAAHVKNTGLDLEYMEYDWDIMVLDPSDRDLAATNIPEELLVLPENNEERKILQRLKHIQQTRDKEIIEKFLTVSGPKIKEVTQDLVMLQEENLDENLIEYSPASEAIYKTMGGEGKYVYYQPIYWKSSCAISCHNTDLSMAFTSGSLTENQLPFNVVRIVKPDKITQAAIITNRAYLMALAITTVVLAMVALWIIVKYAIVKPLTHLRDVSDEVSRGNTSLRAEIQTNDEFEDLATSFNRMLRTLIDAQSEQMNANLKLDSKVVELARTNVQLFETNRVKSDFLANMSHELRTPLNSILGFSDVLQGIDQLDDKQKRYVLNIQKSGRLLLDMINDILDLAKIESGRMEVRPTEFSLHAIVQASCDMVRSLTEEKNIDLDCNVLEVEEPVYQDQAKFQQILTNLLSNAIKFTPEGGRITVDAFRTCDTQSEEEKLVLRVKDTGVGIAEEDRDLIFEKFRQASASQSGDTLTREYSGTGLGLSIVREICDLLGGQVSLESELGQGSTFIVQLPWIIEDRPDLTQSSISSKLDDLNKIDFPRLASSTFQATETPPSPSSVSSDSPTKHPDDDSTNENPPSRKAQS